MAGQKRAQVALERLQFYLDRASARAQQKSLSLADEGYGLFYHLAEALQDGGPGIGPDLMAVLQEFFRKYRLTRTLSHQGISSDRRKLTQKRTWVPREYLAEHLDWEITFEAAGGAEGDASGSVVEAISLLLNVLDADDYVRIARCESPRCGKLFVYVLQGRPRKHCSTRCRIHKFRDVARARK